MNRILPFLLLLAMVACTSRQAAAPDPVDYVNPLVGTLSTYNLSTGNTYPAVAVPWGMHAWTPQTGADGDGWTYRYDATHIRGFKQTHQPSPWINDYGAFSLMPVTGESVWEESARGSWFSHKAEKATPYSYSVYLADYDVRVEMVPSAHAAAFRIQYPAGRPAYLVVDAYAGGRAELVDSHTLSGVSVQNHGGVPEGFGNYFVIQSDAPMEQVPAGDHTVLVRLPEGREVNLRVASSFISAQQARLNLREAEGGLEAMKADARKAWNNVLGRIEVEDPDLDHLRTFYSCLYRCLLFPRDLSETDAAGNEVHYSPHNGQVCSGPLYTDTGFWDTFRALLPLVNLVYPETAVRIQQGLVNHYKESGFLPEWASPGHRDCMVGNNSASVVADAYLKGIRGQDMDVLWEAVTHGAHAQHPSVGSTGRAGWQLYDSLGYVPCDAGIAESAARTLEYAYADWCIWQLGLALGKPEAELAPYKAAAQNYRHLFDPEYGLMNGRRTDGSFRRPFNPLKWGGDFTEGNSLHYTWSVFHDIPGLMELMGGPEAFAAKLDSVFTMPPLYDDSYYGFPIHEIVEMTVMGMGNYAHGNQPIQHMLYLYDWCGQPWKTQARVREVMEKFYTPWADGYCGDEDNGQTSAWYVFSALGFYPVCPGSNEYALGTPLFRKATVHLSGGDLVIDAPENAAGNCYVRGLKLNGRPWDGNYLRHSDLTSGARLRFSLSSTPSASRGIAPEDHPRSSLQH